jgi:Putative adhesin
MKSRHGWSGAALLCLSLVSVACDVKVGESGGLSVDFTAGKATDEWVRTYDLKPGGRLDIVNVNGQIEASASSGTTVEVHAMREARAGSEDASRELLRKTEMREEVAPDHVIIQAPEDQDRGRGFRRPQLTIKYDVRIPAGLNILLKTQNGEVRLENIQGMRIEAASTNGGIVGRGLSGAVEASTVNGGISMDLEAVTGETRMVTVNGGVILNLAPGVNADLEATVVNGGVQIQEALQLSGDERSRQRVSGRIGSGGPRLVVQTTNGGVRVGLRGAPGS